MDRYEKSFPVSWEQFHRDARALAWRLADKGPFSAIVAVTRGGLVPAAVVARELDLRIIETIGLSSYRRIGEGEADSVQGDVEVIKPLTSEISAREGVLVVDDLADTGRTFATVRDLLPDAHFATVYAKPQGRRFVDSFVTEVSQDTWIYFPWDLDLAFAPPITDRR